MLALCDRYSKPSKNQIDTLLWLTGLCVLTLNGLSLPYGLSQPLVINQKQAISYTAIDLYKYSDRGHLQQLGPMLYPGAPGWGRHSNSTHLSGTFRQPESYKGKVVSWIEGRGGTIYFPISEGESQLEELLIWLHPIAAHQVVSIFVDEVLIKNLSLQNKGRYYRLKLPKTLEQGEHSLRLYFRFTRPSSWGGRTPGAIGPISFVPKGQREQMIEQWTGEVIHAQRKWGVLFAPSPCTWRFYFIPPIAAKFKTSLYLPPLAPKTRFQVYIATDHMTDRIIFDETLSSSKVNDSISKSIILPLDEYVGQPVRLTLKTQKLDQHPLAAQKPSLAEKTIPQIGWLTPRIDSMYPKPQELPRLKRLIIWAVDGLKLDTLIHTPELMSYVPSLKSLISQGISFSRLWSNQVDQRGGHLILLQPSSTSQSLLQTIKRLGGWTAYIGSTLANQPKLNVRFDSVEYVDPQELDEHPYRGLLMQVQQMSKLGNLLHERSLKNQSKSKPPELIYIHSPFETTSKRSSPFPVTKGEKKWLSQFELNKSTHKRWLDLFSHLKKIDYSLAQLLSELSLLGLEKDTAILLTGTVGLPPRLSNPSPRAFMQHIETSAILLHPQLFTKSSYQIDRAHLSALSDTLLSTLTSIEDLPEPSVEQRGSLAPYLLKQMPIPLFVDQAQKSAHFIVRMNNYYLFERPLGQPTLWHLSLQDAIKPNPPIKDLSKNSPILLRTMRDGITTSPLFEGLK